MRAICATSTSKTDQAIYQRSILDLLCMPTLLLLLQDRLLMTIELLYATVSYSLTLGLLKSSCSETVLRRSYSVFFKFLSLLFTSLLWFLFYVPFHFRL